MAVKFNKKDIIDCSALNYTNYKNNGTITKSSTLFFPTKATEHRTCDTSS